MSKKIVRTKEAPLVSVLIPTYNRKWLLPRALQSVLTQTYRNVEVILVNDAGEDVQDVVDKFNDPRIKYFQNEKNLDLAGTRNVALKHSTGDYICLLDDDDIHLPLTLEFRVGMIEKIRTNGNEAEVVYTRALQDIWDKKPEGYVSIHKQLYWDSPFNKDLILIQNIAPCCCPLFSRKALEETDYEFDETLTTSEDWDFWVHMSRKFDFWELKLVDCECSIRQDATQMTGSRQGYTNHLPYLFKKWRPYATNLTWVTEHQNNALKARGLNPTNYDL
jgi:glycosyltransferase involved in cell wall biosynthesis